MFITQIYRFVLLILPEQTFFTMSWLISNSVRVGNGYDVHALKEGLPMWLCGVKIPSEKGFVAHSDGDVAIHALCDALLGAAALGDIGQHFPDSDPKYKGIDSKKLLAEVVEMLKDKSLKVALLSIPAAYCQLFGYGLGFLGAAWKDILSKKQPSKTEKS